MQIKECNSCSCARVYGVVLSSCGKGKYSTATVWFEK